MDEKIQATVKTLNKRLHETSATPYVLDVAEPGTLKLLDKNARYMSHEMFENLVANIKRDGGLSSLPLCYREPDGTLLVLSGNHRVQAATQAGIEQILVMVIDRELTREEQVAIQLSHNAIDGKDDPLLLKQLWDEIKQIDLKLYAGLDSETIKELEKIQFVSISEARLEYKEIKLLFLPEGPRRAVLRRRALPPVPGPLRRAVSASPRREGQVQHRQQSHGVHEDRRTCQAGHTRRNAVKNGARKN
jgi:hypothetical protein